MEVAKQSSDVGKQENRPKTPTLDADSDAFENARLANEVQRLLTENKQRNAELAIISSVQQGLASKLEFQSIIDLVGDQVHAITSAKSISIALYDKTSGMMSWPYWLTLGKRIEIPDRPMEKGITRWVMYADKPLNLGTEEEILAHDAIPPQTGWTVGKSFLGVPFTVGNAMLGALSLHDFEGEHAFNESDERLLQTLANSMSLALENALLFADTEQRAAELQIINSVQEGLATKLEIQAIYDLVGDKIREIFHNADAEIRIHDPKTNVIRFPYFTDMGKRITMDPIPLTDVGVSSYVLRTGKTLVVNENLLQEMEKYGAKMLPGGHPAKSAVFVPLTVNNQARGLLVLGDVEHEHAFSETDVRLLQTLANSMSTALENARLFDETQSLLKETEQRNAELAIINSVQAGLASKLDMQAIYDLVGNKIRDIFHAQGAAIYLFDHTKEVLETPYCYLKTRFEIEARPFSEHPIAKLMISTRQPIIYHTVEEYRAMGGAILENSDEYKSGMYVPLIVGKEIRGMVGIANLDKENAYNDSDLRLLQTLANSMSVALENARLFDETQRLFQLERQRAAELVIINGVQSALAKNLDIQAIYDIVGDKIRDVFDAQAVILMSFGEMAGTEYYFVEKGERFYDEPLALSELHKTLIRTGKTLVFNENTYEELLKLGAVLMPGTEAPRSAVFVPLMISNRVFGVISLQNVDHEHAFAEAEVRLLETLASSMSVALENARLFDETQRLLKETEQRNRELAIINSVQAGLAEGLASQRDMQAIYDLVGDKIRELFPSMDTEIRIYDPKTNLFNVPYYIENGQRVAVDPISPSDARLSAHVLHTGQTLVINENIFQEMEKYGAKMMHGRRVPAKSVVFVPLMVGNQASGLIVLNNVEQEHAFSPPDVRLFETLANSMSTALENARLFDEVQRKNTEITESLERETASNDILRVIAESPTNIQPVLDVIVRNAAQLSGSDDAIITLREGDILRVDAHYGDVPTFPVGEGMRFNRDSVAGRAILDGRPLQAIHNQLGVKSEFPEGDKVAQKYGYRMTCAVPLMREGKAIGAISIRRIQPELLTEKQIALIQSFANQAAIAVENVRLFNETTRLLKETEQRAAELAIINSVQEGLASKLDMQAIYDLVGDKIRDLLNAQSVWIITFDPATRTRRVRYSFENGQRYYTSESLPYNKLTEHLIATKKPLVINENFTEAIDQFEMVNIAGTQEQIKSIVYIPIIAGEEVKGFISLPNIERENAFSESDVNLLSTFASSMSIALENIRLFDETRRLLKETEQRATELAIINSVQSALAENLDIQAIYDIVGNKIQNVFNAQTVILMSYGETASTVHYYVEKGERFYDEPITLGELHKTLIRTGKTLVFNENTYEELLKLGCVLTPGSEAPRSAVFVPLMISNRVFGVISLQNVDHEHAFAEAEVRLLETLASSMSVALENARLFDETQRLLKETEQRNAELAIINSVQEGLASKLDMQAIYDLVGDKIRDLFSAQSVWIVTLDRETRTRHFKYSYEKGQRFYPSGVHPFNKLSDHLMATKKTVVINQNANAIIAEFGMSAVAGTERFKSAIFVPLIADGEVKAFISLQNIEQENAFSESDISLLSTLASSMSVALENARLFDETQRLLKETEQRAAELAIINSVQEGLSSKLDMQAIYELVGDEMQEIFDAQSLLIVTFDHDYELAHMTYNREKGTRYYSEPYPLTGLHRYLIQSRNTVVINENAREWQAKYGMILVPGTELPKSMIFVPLTSGYRVSGMISLQNVEREHAFSETDVRLLETLAASMSVALENASLFDETQRLFLEAKEARTAAEQANQAKSAFLSSMSHELRTPLNAIINFVEMIARGMIGPVNREQVELLDQALDSSKHLLNLINDVLDISKIQAGQLTLFIEDQVSVQVEVEAALNIVGGLLQEKGLQLIRDIDPHLPLISCDRRRLRQVLLNLTSNAIKFTNKGTVTVSVKNQGQEMLFAVIDTGPGIPPEEQDLIFEPFIQAENGERQVHGTGLGLPISRSLVRAHGGELWVDSQSGEGSAFFFTLPVERSTP